jgi:diadenylate cyclase
MAKLAKARELDDLLRPFLDLRDLPPRQVVTNVIDILLVAYLLYRLLTLVRGTRAWRIIIGVMIFAAVVLLSRRLGLNTLYWVLSSATYYLAPAALVLLFLPELRAAIEGFGTLPQRLVTVTGATAAEDRVEARTIEELVAACTELAAESVGALIVIEKDARLEEIASNGVSLNARVSAPLLGSIFYENNPLHDGAVLIRGDQIVSAACRLPLSESQRLDQTVHMRHRAAVGATEAFDCIVVAVSEERGTISTAKDGKLKRLNSAHELRDFLNAELRNMESRSEPVRKKARTRRRMEAKR